jgi:2-methylisocitrate lyase-like PEP mutase family enzyme
MRRHERGRAALPRAARTVGDHFVAGVGSYRPTLAELRALGVRRVTIGTSFVRAALGALVAAAREVLERGSFSYADGLMSVDEVNALLEPPRAG